jgi:pyruvate dehydrogenase E1 component alpha subunit
VDGNDVLAVYAVTRAAVERARSGHGPTLIEAVTYRIGPHTTADDPSRYRNDEEVASWRERDPIERYRRFLLGRGLLDEDGATTMEADADAWVSDVRAGLVALGTPPASEVFDHVFAEPPPTLQRQRAELLGDA